MKANNLRFVLDHWQPALAIIGTAIISYPTVLQFTKAPESSELKTRLQRSQLVVQLSEVHRDLWIIALNQELNREKPSSSLLGTAALNTIIRTAQWRAFMAMRVAKSPDAYSTAISDRERIIDQAQTLQRNGNILELLNLAKEQAAAIDSLNEVGQLDERFFAEVGEANAKDALISAQMVTANIVGSFIVLVSAVGSTLQANRRRKEKRRK